jgi:hypothetical protein
MLRNVTRPDPNILSLINFNSATFSRYAYSKQSMSTGKLVKSQKSHICWCILRLALRLKQITGVPENMFRRKCRFLAQSPVSSRKQAYGIKPLLSPLKTSQSTERLSRNVVQI